MAASIVMLVANEVVHDGRVRKTAASLARAGYRVTVLGVARGAEPATSSIDGFSLRIAPFRYPGLDLIDQLKPRVGELRAEVEQTRGRMREARRRLKRARRHHRPVAYLLGRLELCRAAHASRQARRRLVSCKAELTAARQALVDGKPHRYDAAWDSLLADVPVPDVVHVHDHHPLVNAARAVDRWREQGHEVRLVYDAHEYLTGREAAKLERGHPEVLAAEALVAPKADAVVTVSEPIADLLQEQLGLRERPTVMHNAPRMRVVPSLRAAAGVDTDVPLVVYAGASNERRGIDTLVRAVAQLRDVHLVLVVDTAKSHTRVLLDLAAHLGVSERVHTAPLVPVEQVVPYLAEATVGAYTPRDDGVNHVAFPNKILEYVHAGLALVVTDLGEIGRFVRDTGVGEAHPPGDVEGCARAILTVLAAPDTYRRGRAELIEKWSWEAQETRLLALYEQWPAAAETRTPTREPALAEGWGSSSQG